MVRVLRSDIPCETDTYKVIISNYDPNFLDYINTRKLPKALIYSSRKGYTEWVVALITKYSFSEEDYDDAICYATRKNKYNVVSVLIKYCTKEGIINAYRWSDCLSLDECRRILEKVIK